MNNISKSYLKVKDIFENFKKIQHLEDLDYLELSNEDYIIVGSAAAILYGALGKNSDLDVLLRKSVLNRLLDEGKIKIIRDSISGIEKYSAVNSEGRILNVDLGVVRKDGEMELFDDLDIVYNYLIIGGYRFLSLTHAIKFYRILYNRYGSEKHSRTLSKLERIHNHLKLVCPTSMFLGASARSLGNSLSDMLTGLPFKSSSNLIEEKIFDHCAEMNERIKTFALSLQLLFSHMRVYDNGLLSQTQAALWDTTLRNLVETTEGLQLIFSCKKEDRPLKYSFEWGDIGFAINLEETDFERVSLVLTIKFDTEGGHSRYNLTKIMKGIKV